MPPNWQSVNSYKDRDTLVTVYRPRRSASAGAWVALASVVLLVAVGGGVSDPADGTPPASGESATDSVHTDNTYPSGSTYPDRQNGAPGPVTAVVRAPGGLPVRAQADTRAVEVGRAPENSSATVACHTDGPAVFGRSRTSDVWVRMTAANGASGYAPDVWLVTRGDVRSLVPPCPDGSS
ncbi:hypothetical protein [Streptodolium elevatio]